MLRLIDRLLDHITMYRLVLDYLVVILVTALVLSLFGLVPFPPENLALSAALIFATCWLANRVFAVVFAIPANIESATITALILALILDPVGVGDVKGMAGLAFASVWAIASKFILAVRGKHIFNPAAAGAFLGGLLLDQPATWWVANAALLPVVLAGGILIVRKTRQSELVAAFALVNLAAVVATSWGPQLATALRETLLTSPFFFFAFAMLTEPLTAPTGRWPRLLFAALVGFLAAPEVHAGSLYFTPELALLIGNLFAFAIAPQRRFILTLERIEQTAADTFDFVFRSPHRVRFQPGQYVEFTLPVPKADNRGNRRYFTLASSPGERRLRLGVKFYPAASAFKRALAAMTPGDTIHAAQVAGDFTLPRDRGRKIAFIAGGIGITPFRSMIRHMLDNREVRPVTILYAVERQRDIAYRDILDAAADELGIATYYAVARDPGPDQYPGYVDARLLQAALPDYRERLFYVSGPQPMVQAMRRLLHQLGVHRSQIKVDFFPGFA
ncbi:MAG TPA: RnfABCDGE type electron transport complex subunit D [Bauldia sp.]|nr:RnfABCDGE type electron transport complex subunit D [Bauldia sp.]